MRSTALAAASAASAPSRRDARAVAWRAPALLVGAVLLAYLDSFRGAFQFDDFNVIVLNPVVHSLTAWWADLGHGIRPLLKLSYAVNWVLQPDAFGFHVVNVGVHIANTLLVFMLIEQMLAEHTGVLARHARVAALAAALVFALHPAQTEAVTYVSGRSSSLMTTFYLAALLAYVRRGPHDGHLRRLLAPLCFCLALATKETAVTLPFALLLWETSRPGPRRWADIARRQRAFWVVLAAAALFWIGPVYGERVMPDFDWPSLYRNALSQIDAIGYLAGRLVVVHPLNIDPDLRIATEWSMLLVAKAAALSALVAMAWWQRRARPWWLFGIAWFLLQLAPTNALLPRLDLANDRQLYLAGLGVFAAAGVEFALLRASRASRHVPPWTMAALLCVLAALTALRNFDYTSQVRLWEQTAQVSPAKARVFNNLGHAYSAAGCLAQAEAAYREALRLKPGYVVAQENLLVLVQRAEGAPPLTCVDASPVPARTVEADAQRSAASY